MSPLPAGAAVLLFAVTLHAQPTAPAARGQERARELVAAVRKEVGELKLCRDQLLPLQRDFAQKQSQIEKEFGRIPESFLELLTVKRRRLDRLHAACKLKSELAGKKLEEAQLFLVSVEPKSSAWIPPVQKEIEDLTKRYSALTAAGPR